MPRTTDRREVRLLERLAGTFDRTDYALILDLGGDGDRAKLTVVHRASGPVGVTVLAAPDGYYLGGDHPRRITDLESPVAAAAVLASLLRR